MMLTMLKMCRKLGKGEDLRRIRWGLDVVATKGATDSSEEGGDLNIPMSSIVTTMTMSSIMTIMTKIIIMTIVTRSTIMRKVTF